VRYLRTVCSAIIVFSTIIAATCNGAEIEVDGNWWNSQPPAQRLSWLGGFMIGRNEEARLTLLLMSGAKFAINVPNCDQHCYANIYTYQLRLAKMVEDAARYYNGITVGQIADGLSTMFNDYRNRQIRLRYAVAIVEDSIKGSTDEQIQGRLEALRRGCPDRC
jgi:hypothetical protein